MGASRRQHGPLWQDLSRCCVGETSVLRQYCGSVALAWQSVGDGVRRGASTTVRRRIVEGWAPNHRGRGPRTAESWPRPFIRRERLTYPRDSSRRRRDARKSTRSCRASRFLARAFCTRGTPTLDYLTAVQRVFIHAVGPLEPRNTENSLSMNGGYSGRSMPCCAGPHDEPVVVRWGRVGTSGDEWGRVGTSGDEWG